MKIRPNRIRNPKGYDVDHTRDHPDHMRLQYSRDNRARASVGMSAGRARGEFERIRTKSGPDVNGRRT